MKNMIGDKKRSFVVHANGKSASDSAFVGIPLQSVFAFFDFHSLVDCFIVAAHMGERILFPRNLKIAATKPKHSPTPKWAATKSFLKFI
jgi:hypothetical protein